MLGFLAELLAFEHLPARTFLVSAAGLSEGHARTYSDATGRGGLGVVLIFGQWRLWAAGTVPEWFTLRMSRDTQVKVNQYEAAGVVASDLTFADVLVWSQVYHWLDNTSAQGALVNGYSGKEDLAQIVHVATMVELMLGLDKFLEHCVGPANPADLPSRLLELRGTDRWEECFGEGSGFVRVPLIFPTEEEWDDPACFLRRATARRRGQPVAWGGVRIDVDGEGG